MSMARGVNWAMAVHFLDPSPDPINQRQLSYFPCSQWHPFPSFASKWTPALHCLPSSQGSKRLIRSSGPLRRIDKLPDRISFASPKGPWQNLSPRLNKGDGGKSNGESLNDCWRGEEDFFLNKKQQNPKNQNACAYTRDNIQAAPRIHENALKGSELSFGHSNHNRSLLSMPSVRNRLRAQKSALESYTADSELESAALTGHRIRPQNLRRQRRICGLDSEVHRKFFPSKTMEKHIK
jgi:hypothetical protein